MTSPTKKPNIYCTVGVTALIRCRDGDARPTFGRHGRSTQVSFFASRKSAAVCQLRTHAPQQRWYQTLPADSGTWAVNFSNPRAMRLMTIGEPLRCTQRSRTMVTRLRGMRSCIKHTITCLVSWADIGSALGISRCESASPDRGFIESIACSHSWIAPEGRLNDRSKTQKWDARFQTSHYVADSRDDKTVWQVAK